MKAGAAKRDITRPDLMGNPPVHDPLFARVFVLDDSENPVAIIKIRFCRNRRLASRNST